MLWGGWWLEGLLVWEVRSTTGMKLNGYMCWCCTADVWWWPKGLFVFLLAARASALINLSVHTRDPLQPTDAAAPPAQDSPDPAPGREPARQHFVVRNRHCNTG